MQNPPGTRSARCAWFCTAVTILLGPCLPPKRGKIFLTHFCCLGSCRESGWRCVGAEPHGLGHGIWGLYGSSWSECAKTVTLGCPGCSQIPAVTGGWTLQALLLSFFSSTSQRGQLSPRRLLEAREATKQSGWIHPNLPNDLNQIIRGTSLPPTPLPSPRMAERNRSTPAALVWGLLQRGERGWGSLTPPRGWGSGCPIAGHASAAGLAWSRL